MLLLLLLVQECALLLLLVQECALLLVLVQECALLLLLVHECALLMMHRDARVLEWWESVLLLRGRVRARVRQRRLIQAISTPPPTSVLKWAVTSGAAIAL